MTTRVQARPASTDVDIGKRIERRLSALGMTQWDLAARLGLTQATVSRKLHGQRPWFASELVTVAGVLGCAVGELFGERCRPAVRPNVARI
ncbi:helix-turn-helix DNA binding domain protein [Arthrobacter phage Arby]|uniref:Helix-turn-helix DNA binding domain protein n=8 Tax=Decurrovirus decurro TaxID=1982105 RepID=A0A345M4I8_9CAUD|nr:helix-turn-helix DNA binding domain protein [Arthrobacter phage Azathoth]AXH65357.1 helix-turn-helix DNA binding domain protein [Arthrobacter phage CGermain]AXH65383.1 helix-turn-helix DNA binding domain protein [Arthrobacter phage Copper]AXH65409.1 helix-turn-helix DNA binding domain protein [Arthrobacter phage Dewayne]AXH65676.1 helix-turn-helix DNA binding domain protein [Arthrobacter phage Hunnie]AXH65847.1 helix-turn-helix DNA binding domain protein [Arthrobacter phage Inspire2]AXH661